MGEWNFLALVFTGMGFQMNLLAFIVSDNLFAFISNDDTIEALLIIGFLMYSISFMGLLLYNYGDTPLKSNKYTPIVCAVALFLAALFIICGVGVAGDRMVTGADLPHYTTTVYCMALLFAIFAGAICVFDIVQGSGGAVQATTAGGHA